MKKNLESILRKSPRLKTVNFEIRDPSYFFLGKRKLDPKKLNFEMSFNIQEISKLKTIHIFIHLQFTYSLSNDEEINIYHTDQTIDYPIDELKDEYEFIEIADKLGRAFVMAKGAYDHNTCNHVLSEYPMPLFNPSNLLKKKFELSEDENSIRIPRVKSLKELNHNSL